MANYTTAENITSFLMIHNGSLTTWQGKLSKADQLTLFGHYFGRGMITINPLTEIVYHSSGKDCETTCEMTFTGEIVFNNRSLA